MEASVAALPGSAARFVVRLFQAVASVDKLDASTCTIRDCSVPAYGEQVDDCQVIAISADEMREA